MENVPEVTADDPTQPDEDLEKDPHAVSTIKTDMESHDFSVVFAADDAVSRGSLCTRHRIYPVIIDAHPQVFKQYQGEMTFKRVYNSLKLPEPYALEMFEMRPELLEEWCTTLEFGTDIGPLRKSGAKKAKTEDSNPYQQTHEALFSYCKHPWPVSQRWEGFRPRECECISLASAMFPIDPETERSDGSTVPMFFDANHSAERTFRWPPKMGKDKKLLPIKNPWRTSCPTFTALSRIVMRRQVAGADTVIKRLHPLEQMRMMGWDLQMYDRGKPPFARAMMTEADLANLAGNMWSGFTFIVTEISLAGRVPWEQTVRDNQVFV